MPVSWIQGGQPANSLRVITIDWTPSQEIREDTGPQVSVLTTFLNIKDANDCTGPKLSAGMTFYPYERCESLHRTWKLQARNKTAIICQRKPNISARTSPINIEDADHCAGHEECFKPRTIPRSYVEENQKFPWDDFYQYYGCESLHKTRKSHARTKPQLYIQENQKFRWDNFYQYYRYESLRRTRRSHARTKSQPYRSEQNVPSKRLFRTVVPKMRNNSGTRSEHALFGTVRNGVCSEHNIPGACSGATSSRGVQFNQCNYYWRKCKSPIWIITWDQ